MTKITDILETMEYGPAPEDASIVREWLNDHSDGFGHFIDGEFTKPGSGFAVSDPATESPLQMSRRAPPKTSAPPSRPRAAWPKWAALGGHERAGISTPSRGMFSSMRVFSPCWRR